MTNDRELVKQAMTPTGNMVLDTINWLEKNNSFINSFSQYLLSIYHASAFAPAMEYSNEQD